MTHDAPAQPIPISSWFGPIHRPGDPWHTRLRPRWKVRGRRRYYRALHRNAAVFQARPGPYDGAHWHVDWHGIGNLRWRDRREHLVALFTMFRRLLAQVEGWTTPHQVWVHIDPYDGSNDSVNVHTPRPDRDDFPHGFEGVRWGAEVPERLRDLVSDPTWEFGRFESTEGTGLLVRRREGVEG